MRSKDTVIMCPDCKHKQHAMSMSHWKNCEDTKITFTCKITGCDFKETRDGILWMHLVSGGLDKNGC